MTCIPTPGTPERTAYDAGRRVVEQGAFAYLDIYRDDSDELLAARLRGVLDALAVARASTPDDATATP